MVDGLVDALVSGMNADFWEALYSWGLYLAPHSGFLVGCEGVCMAQDVHPMLCT